MPVSIASIPNDLLNKFEDCQCDNNEKALFYHDDEDKEKCPLGVKQFLYCETCSDREKHNHLGGKIYRKTIQEGLAWGKLRDLARNKKQAANHKLG
jgi:hypothetical protein